MKVLNMGSLNLDYVYQVDHIVTGGETLASGGMEVFCGGKGLNQSIALARAGVPVYHAGMIGEDGEMLLDICRENGVDTRYIRRIPGKKRPYDNPGGPESAEQYPAVWRKQPGADQRVGGRGAGRVWAGRSSAFAE